MVRLHGSVFIVVGLLVAIVSFLIDEGMILFQGVGIAFFVFGVIRLFINTGKLRSREEVRKDIMERRARDKHNKPEDRYHRMVTNHHKERINNIRNNHPNNHHINNTTPGRSYRYHSNHRHEHVSNHWHSATGGSSSNHNYYYNSHQNAANNHRIYNR